MPLTCTPRGAIVRHVTSIVIEEVSIVATHSKTRRAVQRLRRLARRLREAELRKARRGGTDKPR
jgi:hypothetical protein